MTTTYNNINIRFFKFVPSFLLVLILTSYFDDVYCQDIHGIVVSKETHKGIGFVNIGIINSRMGTISDENGYFTLDPDARNTDDSLLFSMIGYKSKIMHFNHLSPGTLDTIILDPITYTLPDVKISYKRIRKIILGIPVSEGNLQMGFDKYNLGAEIGINVNLDDKVILNDINLNIRTCSFDSVIYRLNIYKCTNQSDFQNILSRPIYVSFSKNDIHKPITCDLSNYSIIISGNVIIALQLIKNMGPGDLNFRALDNISNTYFRKSIIDSWKKSPGIIGIYLTGQKTE